MFTPLVSLRPRSELGSAAMEFLRCWLLHRSTWMILVPGILPAHLDAVASLALALGAIALRAPLWFVYAVVAVAAASSTIDQSARSATIPRLVSRPLLPSAMSLGQVLFQTAAIAGPALAGAVLAGPGLSWAYAIDV